MEPEVRDSVVSYVEDKRSRTDLKLREILKMIGITKGKFYDWFIRVGQPNNHNAALPKRTWLLAWEKKAIIKYASTHFSESEYFLKDGYRRLTYQMMDENIVAVSPSSVYRVLKAAGLLNQWNTMKTGSKGNGFKQPIRAHEHWHIDIKYINFHGTFLFLISVMDGHSRYIVHHEVRANMAEYDVQITLARAKEKYPDEHPRVISDNGGQFIAKDFQKFIKALELTHIRTSVAYPQSNGKLERFHKSLGIECLSTKSFVTIEDAREIIAKYIDHYNRVRLHSSLFYLTPEDFLEGREKKLVEARENKLRSAADSRAAFWTKEAA